jgi:5-formyltetrahydrofolate cyclo-ligase
LTGLIKFVLKTTPSETSTSDRAALRGQLHSLRDAFASGPLAAEAGRALEETLGFVLAELEPELLGVYWPLGSEFNARALWARGANHPTLPLQLALPFAHRTPASMHYRAWNSAHTPSLRDDCNVPSTEGPLVVPDVVLVPCLGFTRAGWRLGYGGGYFDRWLAQHPGVTAVGVAWSVSELPENAFEPQPFDQALTLVVTENGVA